MLGSFWQREKRKWVIFVAFTQAQTAPTLLKKTTDFQFLRKPQPHGELVCSEQWAFLEWVCRKSHCTSNIVRTDVTSSPFSFCTHSPVLFCGTVLTFSQPTKQKYIQFIFQYLVSSEVGFNTSSWLDPLCLCKCSFYAWVPFHSTSTEGVRNSNKAIVLYV